jgi:hypothetical protein
MLETSKDVFFGKQANFQSDTNTGNNDGHSHSIADDATTIGTNRKRKTENHKCRQAGGAAAYFLLSQGLNQKHTRDRNSAQPKQKQITIIPRTRRRKEEEEEDNDGSRQRRRREGEEEEEKEGDVHD